MDGLLDARGAPTFAIRFFGIKVHLSDESDTNEGSKAGWPQMSFHKYSRGRGYMLALGRLCPMSVKLEVLQQTISCCDRGLLDRNASCCSDSRGDVANRNVCRTDPANSTSAF